MLQRLDLKKFTLFDQARFDFSPGLNLIVGENGLGKTHLLKLGYLACGLWHSEVKDKSLISKGSVEKQIAERLSNLFKAEKIGNLCSTNSKEKTQVTARVEGTIPTVSVHMPHETPGKPMSDEIDWRFQFSSRSESNVVSNVVIEELQDRLTENANYGRAVYLPSKEMLSFFEGFIALYQTHSLAFDETFYDLAIKLSMPTLKERPPLVKKLLTELSQTVGGDVQLDGGRFYIVQGKKRREVTLLAEGLRKLATLMQLLTNGSLAEGDTLFWDEPESNLNPKLIKLIAEMILHLCANGIQVIIATHSLFLLRELEVLSEKKEFKSVPQRYFSLCANEQGVNVEQGDSIEDIQTLVLLDEELNQSQRYMEAGG
ncbi:ATP-binding protein [Oceanospirillum sp. HFRX-1_2]